MDKKQMLLMAAKAAGMHVWPGRWPQDGMLFASPAAPDPDGKVTGVEWNPLEDDGDALRLAVKLRLDVFLGCYGLVSVFTRDQDQINESTREDPGVATRLAIVRAAAEVGAGMRPFPTAEEIRRDWGGEGDAAIGEQSNEPR